MPRGIERKQPKTIQIKGSETDELILAVEAYAKKLGVQVATAARLLIRAALQGRRIDP